MRPYPSYKDSGVPWLGDIPTHWVLGRLKSYVANVIESTSERRDSDLYIALEHVESWTGRVKRVGPDVVFDSQVKRFLAGDILFGKLRPYLAKVTRPTDDGVCVGEFLVLRPRTHALTATYAEHLLRSKPIIDAVNSNTFGAKMPRADWGFVGGMLVPLPPLAEQRAIVRYLDTIDRRIRRYIRAKQKLLKLLEEQKQALIHQAVTRGLDPNVRLKPSGVEWLGDVPEHWEIVRISKCLSGRNAGIWGTEPDESNADDHIVCVRVADFDMAHLSVSEQKLTVRAVAKTARMSRLLAPGDLLIEKSGGGDAQPVGRAVLFNLGQPCVCSNFIERLIPDRTQVQSHFLLWVLTDLQASRHNVPSIKQTTGIQNLDLGQYFANVLALPPLDEQDRILSTMRFSLDRVQTAVQNTTRSISLLQEYRTRLIADVVTGKLDVREAAARLPDEPTDDDAELAVDDLSEGTETEDEEVPADSEAFD